MRKPMIILMVIVLLGSIIVALVVSKVNFNNGSKASNSSEHNCLGNIISDNPVDCISNEDIHWYWTFSGLEPRLNGAAAKVLETQGSVEPMLLDALLDKNKFAAAHVLLTFRSGSEFLAEDTAWNGLKVELLADDHVSYEGNNLTQLHQRWEEVLQQQKTNKE